MKHFNRHHLAFIPLLSILAMGPSTMESHFHSRSIASIEVAEDQSQIEELARYKSITLKVNPKALMKTPDLSVESHKVKIDKLKRKLEELPSKKDDLNSEDILAEKRLLEDLAVETLMVESGLNDLDSQNLIKPSDRSDSKEALLKSKLILEKRLYELELDEKLIAQKPVQEEKPASSLEEEKSILVVEEEGSKKEEPKEEPKKESIAPVCVHEEKNQALTKQVEQLLADQSKIMQTILGMAQMMVSMFQSQQTNQVPNPYYANNFQFQNPYQYNQFTAGNWVYQPSGFPSSQQNIFSGPQEKFRAQQPQEGFYPDQAHQQNQSSWNLRPQLEFNDPRFQTRPLTPGPFGNEAFSFDMNPEAPIITQF